MNKTLSMLIAPKSSGKPHIGALVGNHTAISFLNVESIWLTLNSNEDGWKKVEEAIW